MASNTTAPREDGQKSLGSVTLRSKYQKDSTGALKAINLTGLMAGIDINISMFSNHLGAAIEVVDSVDLLGTFPLLGEEVINLQLLTSKGEPFTVEMDVVAVGDLVNDPKSVTQYYTIICVSRSVMQNMLVSMDVSHRGSVSDLVEYSITNHLSSRGVEFKINQIDPTQGNQHIVIPGFSPFQTCELCTKYAFHSENPFQTFYFYETLQGFNFRDLSKLLRATPVQKIAYRINEGKEHFLPEQDTTYALDVSFKGRVDSLRYVGDGTLSAKVRETNYHTKTIKDYPNSYLNQVAKIKQSANAAYAQKTIQSTDFISDYSVNPSTYVLTSNEINRNLSSQLVPKFTSNRIFNHLEAQITLSGNASLNPGDTIELDYQRVVSDGTQRYTDKQVSGLYLITDVTHSFTLETFETKLTVVKNSYGEELYNE